MSMEELFGTELKKPFNCKLTGLALVLQTSWMVLYGWHKVLFNFLKKHNLKNDQTIPLVVHNFYTDHHFRMVEMYLYYKVQLCGSSHSCWGIFGVVVMQVVCVCVSELGGRVTSPHHIKHSNTHTETHTTSWLMFVSQPHTHSLTQRKKKRERKRQAQRVREGGRAVCPSHTALSPTQPQSRHVQSREDLTSNNNNHTWHAPHARDPHRFRNGQLDRRRDKNKKNTK